MPTTPSNLDIVPERRIVFAYAMSIAEARISASLGTVELEPAGARTRLTYTEQGTFLDRRDTAERARAAGAGFSINLLPNCIEARIDERSSATE